MARWQGEADVTQESAGGGGGSFQPAPRGIYTIQVADVKEGRTQVTNRPKVDLECEIADDGPEFGKKVWLTITQIPKGEKGHGLMIHSLHAFNVDVDGAYDFDPAVDLQGQNARALLGVTQRESKNKKPDGTPYINDVNFVEQLYTAKHPEPEDGVLPPARAPRAAKPAAAASGRAPVGAGAKAPTGQAYEAGVDSELGF